MGVSTTIHWPRLNTLGVAALPVAVAAFACNVTAGVVLFGWLLAPVGFILAVAALVMTPARTRKEAVAALIVTLGSVFAAVAMFQDTIAPLLPS